MYYVYLLKCTEVGGKNYYIGSTTDLRRRFNQHANGQVRTTKNRNPRLIYYEAFQDKYLALKREKGLKTSGSVYKALLKRLELKEVNEG